MPREIDWRSFVDKLVFCYGCGRFGMPSRGAPPRGWSTLYQPHDEAPVGLHVCSDACKVLVRDAMKCGPVFEPLRMATDVMMSSEMRDQMMQEALAFTEAIEKEGAIDAAFIESVEEEEL